MDRSFADMVKIMAKQCAMNRSLGNSTKSRTHTLVWWEFAEQNSVDGDGNQRREVAGDEETIRTPEAADQDTRGLGSFEEIYNISPVGIYIPTLSV